MSQRPWGGPGRAPWRPGGPPVIAGPDDTSQSWSHAPQAGAPAEQQQASPLAGLLGQVQNNLSTPLTFAGSPGGAAASITPTAQAERIKPGQTFNAPADVQQIEDSQQGQYSAPEAPGALSMNANNQAVNPSQTFQFDPNSGSYFQGPDPRGFAQQGNELEQATYQRGLNRINPGLQQQQQALSQRLVNQGLPIGSEAYNDALNRLDQSQGDQRENLALSSIGAGRQEQGRLFGQDLASRQFGAGEAGRQFGERFGATQFNAGEAGRGFAELMASNQNQFGQNLSANQFNAGERNTNFGQRFAGQQFNSSESARQFAELMAGQSQSSGINLSNRQFDAGEQARNFQERLASQGAFFSQNRTMDQFKQAQANAQASGANSARNQSIREQMLLRQNPLNELSQLIGLAGGAPQQPQFGQTPQFPVLPGDYQGQVNQNYTQESPELAATRRRNQWIDGDRQGW